MKVAVLEDSEFRLDYWNKHFPGYYLFTHVDDLINAAKEENFDIFFLDHDLDGATFVDQTEYNCGTTAATFLCSLELNEPIFIIHSMNFPAAENMKHILKRHYKNVITIPFGWLPKDGKFKEFWK